MTDELTEAERRAALALFRCRAYGRRCILLRTAARFAMMAAFLLAAVVGDLVGAAGLARGWLP